jgi:hypothetical protein
MTTPNQDIYYQYSESRESLTASLIERDQLLGELETLSKAPQGRVSSQIIVRFDLARGQALLFELSVITEKIDSLVVLINSYAQKVGMPPVEMTDSGLT